MLLVLKVNDVDVLHISPEAKDLPKVCNKDSLAAQIKAEQQKFNSIKAFKVGCSEPFSDLSTAKKRFLDMLAACWKHFKDKITDLYHLGVIDNIYEQSSEFQGYNDSSLHNLFLHQNKPDQSESTLQSLYYAFTDHPSHPSDPQPKPTDPLSSLLTLEDRPTFNTLIGIFYNFVVCDPLILKVLEHLIRPMAF